MNFLGNANNLNFMKKSTKYEILNDFICILNQLDKSPSDEIESNLQNIVHKIRPLIHTV